jgi:hypothetical protein
MIMKFVFTGPANQHPIFELPGFVLGLDTDPAVSGKDPGPFGSIDIVSLVHTTPASEQSFCEVINCCAAVESDARVKV